MYSRYACTGFDCLEFGMIAVISDTDSRRLSSFIFKTCTGQSGFSKMPRMDTLNVATKLTWTCKRTTYQKIVLLALTLLCFAPTFTYPAHLNALLVSSRSIPRCPASYRLQLPPHCVCSCSCYILPLSPRCGSDHHSDASLPLSPSPPPSPRSVPA